MEAIKMEKFWLLFLFGITMLFCFGKTFASDQNMPKLLMLSQPLCPPCKSMEKVLDKLQRSYFVEVEDFNVREDMTVAERYGAKKTPFLVFFDSIGTQIGNHAGALSEDEILRIFWDGGTPLMER
jgi:thiol-disulfide isomerase/thioredoxin